MENKLLPNLDMNNDGIFSKTNENIKLLRKYYQTNPFSILTEQEEKLTKSILNWFKSKKEISDKQWAVLIDIFNRHLKIIGEANANNS